MVLTRAGVPGAQHALVFFPHRGLGVKTVSAGVKVAVAPFNVNHKADIAEIAGFGRHVEAEEGDPTLVNSAGILQVRPETCSA